MHHLLTYLRKRWLKAETHEITFYPEGVEGNAQAEQINMLLMVTDVLCSYNWLEPNVISLKY